MKSFVLAAIAVIFLAGCANDSQLAKAQADAVMAQSNARVAEAQAAEAQARAVLALSSKIDAGGAAAYLIATTIKGGQAATQAVQVQQPQSFFSLAWQSALQVADVALRVYGIKVAGDVAINNSNNNRDVSLGSYAAFQGMGASIAAAGTAGYPYVQAPAANVTNTYTLSGTGVLGSGSYTGPITTNRNCNGGTGAAGGNGTTTGGAGGPAPGGAC